MELEAKIKVLKDSKYCPSEAVCFVELVYNIVKVVIESPTIDTSSYLELYRLMNESTTTINTLYEKSQSDSFKRSEEERIRLKDEYYAKMVRRNSPEGRELIARMNLDGIE